MSPASISTLSDVGRSLQNVLDRCREERSRLGYFAALYWHSYLALQRAVNAARFGSTQGISTLGVVFYRRYLRAVQHHWEGGRPSASWQVSFLAARQPAPVVLQHLGLGMNAHIDFDLGVAVAEAFGPDVLPSMEDDFMLMNQVLASVTAEMLYDLEVIWPVFKVINSVAHPASKLLVRFGLEETRARAWRVAQRLVRLSPGDRQSYIDQLDLDVALAGRFIWKPLPPLSWGLRAVRVGELQSVRRVIDQLVQVDVHQRVRL